MLSILTDLSPVLIANVPITPRAPAHNDESAINALSRSSADFLFHFIYFCSRTCLNSFTGADAEINDPTLSRDYELFTKAPSEEELITFLGNWFQLEIALGKTKPQEC